MESANIMEQGKRIVIALPVEILGGLGLNGVPDPGEMFALSGTARARDAFPGGQGGPAEVTFELYPERLEPSRGQGAQARAGQPGGKASAPARGEGRPADMGQKDREAFFRSLFREED